MCSSRDAGAGSPTDEREVVSNRLEVAWPFDRKVVRRPPKDALHRAGTDRYLPSGGRGAVEAAQAAAAAGRAADGISETAWSMYPGFTSTFTRGCIPIVLRTPVAACVPVLKPFGRPPIKALGERTREPGDRKPTLAANPALGYPFP